MTRHSISHTPGFRLGFTPRLAIAGFALASLALSGCASMNLAECQTADWETVGYQDGADGRPSGDISRHREACAKHGVTPLLVAYLDGWNDGVIRYCTVQSGFNAGSSGRSYAGVCPADQEGVFLAGFSDGKHLYSLRSNVRQIVHRISRDEKHLDAIEKDIAVKGARLIAADDTTLKERALLLSDLKQLAEEKGQLEKILIDMEYERGLAEVDLENYRADVALDYGL